MRSCFCNIIIRSCFCNIIIRTLHSWHILCFKGFSQGTLVFLPLQNQHIQAVWTHSSWARVVLVRLPFWQHHHLKLSHLLNMIAAGVDFLRGCRGVCILLRIFSMPQKKIQKWHAHCMLLLLQTWFKENFSYSNFEWFATT